MDNLKDEIVAAYKQGNLLGCISQKTRENRNEEDVLTQELIRLHNEREIDIIAVFKTFKNEPSSNSDFFLTRHLLQKILPKLDAPIGDVMECVSHLMQNMAAGTLLRPFTDFCSGSYLRPKEALALIHDVPEKYYDLLPQVIMAGARLETELYLSEAIRLTKHDYIEIRRKAVISLGRIENLGEQVLFEKAISCLESSVEQETDDHLLGGLVDATFNLYINSKIYNERLTNIIDKALSSNGDQTLHAGAVLFWLHLKELPDALLDCLLLRLLSVKPENKGSLSDIDYGLAELVEQGNWKAVDFLEKLLLANQENLSLDTFDNVMRVIFKNQNNIFNRLMTQWFMKGDRVLCQGIAEITSLAHEGNIQLLVSSSDFDHSNADNIIFLARKAIGYLSSKPVTAASIIVSLTHYATDDVKQILISLIVDFLLINYPGQVRAYLVQEAEIETGDVKAAIDSSIKIFDDYTESIKSLGYIPELQPPQSQREIYRRYFSNLMSQAMKDAQKDSVFLSLVSTSVLLYGRKSIDYVYNTDGQSSRMEIPLQSHSFEGEIPRLGIIDPFGSDYMLRVFRAERIEQ
jgi:hypothetical protein